MWKTLVTLSTGAKEEVTIYEWNEAPLPQIEMEPHGRGWKSGGTEYYNIIAVLDTETSKKTHYDEHGIEQVDAVWIYQWCLGLGNILIAGRSAEDLVSLLCRIHTHYDLSQKKRLVLWIHNEAYDISYLLNGLWGAFGGEVEVFATGQRRAIKTTCGKGLEIRCSWKLVNKSLDAWCADVKTRHRKLTGAIDYNVMRTPQTNLTQTDWDYMINDVLCLQDCLESTLEKEKLRTVPMTSTGFVRRSMRYAAMKDPSWRQKFVDMLPTAEQYVLMTKAFIGGYTHANSLALGIWEDITGYDAASMYPAVLATEQFPMSAWRWKHVRTQAELDALCQSYAVIMEVSFVNLRLKNPTKTWNPYVAYSKCYNQSISYDSVLLDNGKVIQIEHATLAICDIDWKWIKHQYTWDVMVIHRTMFAERGPLPEWFTRKMREWYAAKVQLKGVDDPETERRYMEAKQHLNAIYGFCSTHVVHDVYSYDFINQDWKVPERKDSVESVQDELDKLAKPKSKAFLPYCWGLYTTAHARDRLFTVMDCCNFPLYADTDSVKGGDWDIDKLEQFNALMRLKSNKADFTIDDPSGRPRPIGVFEKDGDYRRFSALHAKCYAYEDRKTGELHAVIAGVTRDNGKPKGHPDRVTKEQELGSLEELQDGKVFTACGGTRAVYKCGEHDIIINGEHIHSFGGCAILDTTYEISGTNDLLAMYGISDPELPYK